MKGCLLCSLYGALCVALMACGAGTATVRTPPPETFKCDSTSTRYYSACGCHPGDAFVSRQLELLQVEKGDGERVRACVAESVRATLKGDVDRFHALADGCLARDILLGFETKKQIRARMAAIRSDEAFPAWMLCYRNLIDNRNEIAQVKEPVSASQTGESRQEPLGRLEASLKEVGRLKNLLGQERAVRKHDSVVLRQLTDALKTAESHLRDLKDHVMKQRSRMKRTDQHLHDLNRAYDEQKRQLECWKAGRGNACNSSKPGPAVY